MQILGLIKNAAMIGAVKSYLRPGLHTSNLQSISLINQHWQEFHSSAVKFHKRSSITYYYDVLEITPKATHKEIKSAFYRLSKIYHPDSNVASSSAERFHEITEAYDILGNHLSRKRYDRGLLRSTPSQRHPVREETKDDSFRHRPFKGRGPIMTGKTKYYDFDEYYKQHYGEHVLHQFKKKHSTHKQNRRQERREPYSEDIPIDWQQIKSANRSFFSIVGIIFIVFACVSSSKIVKELESTSAKPPDR